MTTDTGRLNSLRKDPIRPDTPERECPLGSPHAPPFLLCLSWGGTRGRGLLSSEALPWNPTPGTNHSVGACSGFRFSTLLPLNAPVLSLTLLPDLDSDRSPRGFPLCLI